MYFFSYQQVVAVICLGLSIVIINTIVSNAYFDGLLSNQYTVTSDLEDDLDDLQSLITLTRSLAGYMIFVAALSSLVEIPIILGRFTTRAGIGMLRIFHVVVRYLKVLLFVYTAYKDDYFLGCDCCSVFGNFLSVWNGACSFLFFSVGEATKVVRF